MIEKKEILLTRHLTSRLVYNYLWSYDDIWTVEIIYIIQNSGSMYLLSDATREN